MIHHLNIQYELHEYIPPAFVSQPHPLTCFTETTCFMLVTGELMFPLQKPSQVGSELLFLFDSFLIDASQKDLSKLLILCWFKMVIKGKLLDSSISLQQHP